MRSDPLRIAIAGTRGHWRRTLDELLARRDHPDRMQGQLVAIADAGDSADGLARWAAEQGADVRRFACHREMLEAVRPDLFVVCGPFERHAEMCADAIGRDVAVLAEKPVALDDAQLVALRQVVADHPRVPLAGMMFSRYEPAFLAASELIARGEIGDVRLINVRKSYKLGRRGGYYRDRATYGGTIPWVGSHAIDWMLAFTGGTTPRRVFATHSTVGNNDNGSMETSASCLFDFRNGLSATAGIDTLRPDAASTHGDDWARVVGTRGTIEVKPGHLHVIDAAGTRFVETPPTGRTLVGDLLDAIAGVGEPWVDARATLALTAVLLAARQSADEGRVIEIE